MPSTKKQINLTIPEDVYQRLQDYKKDYGLYHDASACLQLIIQQLKSKGL